MKKGDLQKLQFTYFSMARFLNADGKNPFAALIGGAKTRLLEFKNTAFQKVQIIASTDSCKECKKLNEKVFTVDQALKEMPLPNVNCTSIREKGKKPFGRCSWTTVEDSLTW